MSPEELKLEEQKALEHAHHSALERIRSFEQTLESATKTMLFSEIAKLAVDSFRANKVRFALTALGMVIGTASLILVVTIGLTGKQFILGQIQGIGANWIYAYYEAGGNSTLNTLQSDALTMDDLNAVKNEVPGQTISIEKLQFVVVGVFKEKTDTFGQSEVAEDTILIPYTVARYFAETDAVKQIMFSAADPSLVPSATEQIKQVLQARHRPESVYRVENLTQILTVAAQVANALTMVLLLIATVTLLVSGVGIMNI